MTIALGKVLSSRLKHLRGLCVVDRKRQFQNDQIRGQMGAESKAAHRRQLVVEWATSLYAVFWGAWWAHVASLVLQEGPLPVRFLGRVLPKELTLVSLAFYAVTYAYAYTRWMWSVSQVTWMSSCRFLLRNLGPPLTTSVGLLLALTYLLQGESTATASILYGLLVSILWIPTITFVVLNSVQWEQTDH